MSVPVAFGFIALFGASLALWAWALQRSAPRDEAVPRTITSMSHVGRIAFACLAVTFVLLGILTRSGEEIVTGAAFVLAAAGQQWVHERWRP